MRSSWPFVTLDVVGDELRLSIVLRKAVVKRDRITKVVCEKGPIFSSIILVHDDPEIKANLQFWTTSPGEVISALRTAGYPCEGR